MARVPLPPHFPVPPQSATRRGAPLPPPGRPVYRDPLRPDTRAGEVRGRDGSVLTRSNRSNEQADQFDVPAHMRERGWDLQWVRSSCYGKPDPANVQAHLENGWRAVPSERWPGYFHPADWKGAITREGQILMERPIELTQQAIQDGIAAAQRQRRNQSAAFKGVDRVLDETHGREAGFEAPDAHTDSRGFAAPKLRRTVEQVPVSSYPSRTLAVGSED